VASTPTAWRAIAAVAEEGRLGAVRAARATAREGAWAAGAAPSEIVFDFDSHLLTAHSEKEGATPTWKRGFGFHPLLCYLDETGEALAGVLREGRAGANTAADHLEVLDRALAQIPAAHLDRPMLARSDSAGATHAFAAALREAGVCFSLGFELREAVREAILAQPEAAWRPALDRPVRPAACTEACGATHATATTSTSRCRRDPEAASMGRPVLGS